MTRAVLVQDAATGDVAVCRIGGEPVRVGRGAGDNDLVIADPHVSRRHCTLVAEAPGHVRVIDHGQAGTTINGAPVGSSGVAGPGDLIGLGRDHSLVVVGAVDDDAPPVEGEPRPPARLGPLLLLREVGRGGMGVVYEAWDQAGGKRRAVKWLRVGGRAGAEDVGRFVREVKVQASLRDYPGIARVLDQGTLAGTGELFCVMEFVDGESLAIKLRQGPLAPRQDGVRLVARVARAVEYAHAKGVVHRDLKPGNVLVNAAGMIRLTDFGIARTLDGEGKLTATGMMLGTPGFMAPEQIRGDSQVDPLTDVYGLGSILYAVLTGKPPVHAALTVSEGLRAVLQGKIPPPSSLDATIDRTLDELVLRALAVEPKERVPSARRFAEALEEWLRTHDPAAKVSLKRPRGL